MSYVVSESYPAYRYHIRAVTPKQPVQDGGGFIPDTVHALCGREVRWDTKAPLPTKAPTSRGWDVKDRGAGNHCDACRDAYREHLRTGKPAVVQPPKDVTPMPHKATTKTKTITSKGGTKTQVTVPENHLTAARDALDRADKPLPKGNVEKLEDQGLIVHRKPTTDYTAYPQIAQALPKRATFRDIPQIPHAGYAPHVSWDYLDQQIADAREDHGLDMNPDFQRAHVWTRAQQIAYVEYKLMGGESASEVTIVTDSWLGTKDATFTELLDGKQRIRAIQRFMKGVNPAFGRLIGSFGDNLLLIRPHVIWRVIVVPTRVDALSLYLQMNGGGTVHSREDLDKVMALRTAAIAAKGKK